MAFVGDGGGGGGGGGGWRRCGSEKKKHGLALLMIWKKKVGCASAVVGALECAGMMMMMNRSWCYTGLYGQTVRTARRRRPSPNGHRQSERSVWGARCGGKR